MPISSCGLRLTDDAVRVAVALRLGCSVCDRRLTHMAFTAWCAKKAPSKTRHHAINDVIARSLIAAGVPVTKEPCGLTRTDGKRRMD